MKGFKPLEYPNNIDLLDRPYDDEVKVDFVINTNTNRIYSSFYHTKAEKGERTY